jgi:hypothetical protein
MILPRASPYCGSHFHDISEPRSRILEYRFEAYRSKVLVGGIGSAANCFATPLIL